MLTRLSIVSVSAHHNKPEWSITPWGESPQGNIPQAVERREPHGRQCAEGEGEGMAATMVNADEWLAEITAQARSAQLQVFSVSVPVSHPETPLNAYEQLLSEAIEGIERQGWKLESMSTYGASGSP
jgi:hypothetical protein